MTEHVLTYKAQAAVAVSIMAFALNYTSDHYLVDLVDEMCVHNNDNMNVDFVRTVLPYIKVTYVVTRAVQLATLVLSFKWPKLAGAFYVIELLCLA